MTATTTQTGLGKFKAWLNSVPDCPRCKGTGEAQGLYLEWVWWKGQRVCACDCCGGSGKC